MMKIIISMMAIIIALPGIGITEPQGIEFMHSALIVKDIEKSIPFYRDVLGCEVKFGAGKWLGGPEDKTLCTQLGVKCPAKMRLAVLKMPGSNTELEFLEYAMPSSPDGAPFPQNTWGASHLTFKVKDIDAIKQKLDAAGVKFVSWPNDIKYGPLAGWRWAYFYDPTNYNKDTGNGVLIELVQVDYNKVKK